MTEAEWRVFERAADELHSGTVRFSSPGNGFRARNKTLDAIRERMLKSEDYRKLLLDHYLKGAQHPDDINYSLNQWDDIE